MTLSTVADCGLYSGLQLDDEGMQTLRGKAARSRCRERALRISVEKDCTPWIPLGRKCDFRKKRNPLREKSFPPHGEAARGKRIGFSLRLASRKLCEAFLSDYTYRIEANRA